MKVKANFAEIKKKGKERGLTTYKAICRASGYSSGCFSKAKHFDYAPLTMIWLFSDLFECTMNELVVVDWEK